MLLPTFLAPFLVLFLHLPGGTALAFGGYAASSIASTASRHGHAHPVGDAPLRRGRLFRARDRPFGSSSLSHRTLVFDPPSSSSQCVARMRGATSHAARQRRQQQRVRRFQPLPADAISPPFLTLVCPAVAMGEGGDESFPNGGFDGDSDGTSQQLRVGIAGAGSVAFGTAALLSSLGRDRPIPTTMWSPSGRGTSDLLSKADDDDVGMISSAGVIERSFPVHVARSPRELVEGCDVLVLALPANGHKSVMEALALWICKKAEERMRLRRRPGKNIGDGKRRNLRGRREGGLVSRSPPPPPVMHVIISSHASLGAAYFLSLLREERRKRRSALRGGVDECSSDGKKEKGIGTYGGGGEKEKIRNDYDGDDLGVLVTAWGTTKVTARQTSGTSVNVLTVRDSVDLCTVPDPFSDDSDADTDVENDNDAPWSSILSDGRRLCTHLFGDRFVRRRGGLLAISLSNLNPQNHLGIVLGNMSRMERGEEWYQGQNVTPNVGRLMEALDRERMEIASTLGLDVRNIRQHFSWSFHVPEGPVSEMNRQMLEKGTDVFGPSDPNSRYVTEDVPYGLVLTVALGRLVDRPAVLHEAGIEIVSAMYGRDFEAENEMLNAMNLKKYGGDIKWWREMARTGYFRETKLH